MNIFVTSNCPVESARFLDNVRRNKMLLESCQLLATAVNENGGKAPYKTSHLNHPVSIWTRTSRANYQWLVDHAEELSNLYTEKTGKIHKCKAVLDVLRTMDYLIPDGELTPFKNCARNKEKGVDFSHVNDTIEAYQLYLNERWNGDKREPSWG
jgi:hypothetical protein